MTGAQSYDLKFGMKIAEVFSSSFHGYENLSIASTDISFPLVRIKSRIGICHSLPFGWHSAISIQEPEKAIKEAIQKVNPNILSFSFMKAPSTAIENALLNIGFEKIIQESDILPLKGRNFDDIFKENFSVKVRNQCRKALNTGMTLEKSKSQDDIKGYYALYEEATKKWNYNEPPYPYVFYEKLITECEEVDFWVSKLDGLFLGGVIVLRYEGWLYYWAGMINREHSSLCINNGLLYTAIKFYTETGEYDYYNFGASDNLGSVKKFKESFGTSSIEHYHYEYKSPRYKYLVKPLLDLKQKVKR